MTTQQPVLTAQKSELTAQASATPSVYWLAPKSETPLLPEQPPPQTGIPVASASAAPMLIDGQAPSLTPSPAVVVAPPQRKPDDASGASVRVPCASPLFPPPEVNRFMRTMTAMDFDGDPTPPLSSSDDDDAPMVWKTEVPRCRGLSFGESPDGGGAPGGRGAPGGSVTPDPRGSGALMGSFAASCGVLAGARAPGGSAGGVVTPPWRSQPRLFQAPAAQTPAQPPAQPPAGAGCCTQQQPAALQPAPFPPAPPAPAFQFVPLQFAPVQWQALAGPQPLPSPPPVQQWIPSQTPAQTPAQPPVQHMQQAQQ